MIAKELDGKEPPEMKETYNQLLDLHAPKIFTGKDNVLLNMDKNYTKTLFALAENNIENSANFTMFEWRTAIELLKERSDKIKADQDKMKHNN